MSALNISETESLRQAVTVIRTVEEKIRQGKPLDPGYAEVLKSAREKVNTVLTMKGHYFS